MPRAARTVSVIHAEPANNNLDRTTHRAITRKLKVCAYGRVSTDSEDQQSSFELQVSYYTNYIKQNPEWIFAGIYADEGISGTNTTKRTDFGRMIKDCMSGKIDLIITKSISRFARNTVDCLHYVRMLKEKNVAVYFEEQNINTLDMSGELLLSILSSLAQEESRNISMNVLWGLSKRYEEGRVIVNHNKFMGYTKNKEGDLVIVPEEAEIVKKIFRFYLEGDSVNMIKKKLEAEGIKTVTNKSTWYETVIMKMLKNEKYMGDALLQKTYTVDYLSKKRCINKGERQQYYVEGSHEAIIPKPLFYKVQEEMARRTSLQAKNNKKKKTGEGKYRSTYALSEIMMCAECGSFYRRAVWCRNGKKKVVWRCINRLENGKKYCKESPTIGEEEIHKVIMDILHKLLDRDDIFLEQLKMDILEAVGEENAESYVTGIQKRIKGLENQILHYVELNAKAGVHEEKFNRKYKDIAKQIKELKGQEKKFREVEGLREDYMERESQIEDFMGYKIGMKYDDKLVRSLIQRIRVISTDKIQIQMKTGENIESMI